MTLLEVLVALLLLTVGALALAGSIAYAERARDRALGFSLALAEAESWIESWRGAPWSASADSGSTPVSWGAREGLLGWRVAILRPCLAEGRVEVTPAREGSVSVVLVTRRFREGMAHCEG